MKNDPLYAIDDATSFFRFLQSVHDVVIENYQLYLQAGLFCQYLISVSVFWEAKVDAANTVMNYLGYTTSEQGGKCRYTKSRQTLKFRKRAVIKRKGIVQTASKKSKNLLIIE